MCVPVFMCVCVEWEPVMVGYQAWVLPVCHVLNVGLHGVVRLISPLPELLTSVVFVCVSCCQHHTVREIPVVL